MIARVLGWIAYRLSLVRAIQEQVLKRYVVTLTGKRGTIFRATLSSVDESLGYHAVNALELNYTAGQELKQFRITRLNAGESS